jgi:hypothetical protein
MVRLVHRQEAIGQTETWALAFLQGVMKNTAMVKYVAQTGQLHQVMAGAPEACG